MGERLYSNKASDRAKDLLCHYFEILFERSGLTFESDNQAEIDQIVDEIVEACKEECKPDEATESMQQYYLHKTRGEKQNG